MTANVALRFENLTLGYDGHAAVHHLNGVIKSGSMTAIVGPNGSGKSTLLKGIVGALKPMSGAVHIDKSARSQIAYLPQLAEIDRSFPVTVRDLVSLGLWSRFGGWRPFGQAAKDDVARAISAVGLEGFETRMIDALSGGQLQRVLFARVLVQDSPLILLDEPFTAIDQKTAKDLMDLIERWHGEKRTVLAVLHDQDLVKRHFPEAMMLARHVVAWGPSADVISAANQLKARAMAEAWDEHAPLCNRGAA